MPKLVMKTLKQLDFFMKKYGYKTADLFRRKDLNLSLQQGKKDQLLSVDELVAIVGRISPDIYPGDIRRVVHYLDANDNGELDLDSFQDAMAVVMEVMDNYVAEGSRDQRAESPWMQPRHRASSPGHSLPRQR